MTLASLVANRYHKDVGKGIPARLKLALPEAGLALRYTHHAQRQAESRKPDYPLPHFLPIGMEVVEVEEFQGQVLSAVVRFRWGTKDLVLVLNTDGLVRTMWVNNPDDHHATLNHLHYTERGHNEANTRCV